MKFKMPAGVLTKTVDVVSSVSERKNTIPILGNMLMRTVGKTAIQFRATDLDMEITQEVAADVLEDGDTTVPARLLHDLVRKLAAGQDVQFDLPKGEHQATVTSGRSRFKLQTLPATDYPELAHGPYQNEFRMAAPDLFDFFESVQFAISSEETRYYLNGIYLHTQNDPERLLAVATDGHRLAKMEIDCPAGAAQMKGIIVPRKTVSEVMKLAKALGKDDKVTISVSETKVMFEAGNTTLVSKLIDGTFPDYTRVIPQANNIFAKVDTKIFAAAVDRVATISSERGKAVKLTFKPNELHLNVNNPDAGSGHDIIDIDYDAEPLEIGFNARYLIDIMTAVWKGETKLHLQDAGSPTIVSNEGAKGLLIVLMPMRV